MLSLQAQEILSLVESVYEKESKTGEQIGHGIEHIKGVVKRSAKISQDVFNAANAPEPTPIYDDMIAVTAALHDIGNLIERKGHNVYSGAFLRGRLRLADIETAFNSLNPVQKANNLDAAMDMVIKFNLKMLCPRENMQAFANSDDEVKKEEFITQIANELISKGYLSGDRVENGVIVGKIIPDEQKVKERITANIDKFLNENSFIPQSELDDLIAIREKASKHFGANLNDIIKGVEDHNRDYEINPDGKEDHSRPRTAANLLGQIVFDADKDEYFETFVIRTYLFAKNLLAKESENSLNEANDTLKKAEDKFELAKTTASSDDKEKAALELAIAQTNYDEKRNNYLIYHNEDGTIRDEAVADSVISQTAIRYALTENNINKIAPNYKNASYPKFTIAPRVVPFKDWKDFAECNQNGDYAVEYDGRICYLGESNTFGYYIYDTDERTPITKIPRNAKTQNPMLPSDIKLCYNHNGGRDVRFQLIPNNEDTLTDRVRFFELASLYTDEKNYEKAKESILGIINKSIALGLTPEEAVDYFEGPGTMRDIASNYDLYKMTTAQIAEYNLNNPHALFANRRPLNDIVNDYMEGKEVDWENVAKNYNIPSKIISNIIKNKFNFIVNASKVENCMLNETELNEKLTRELHETLGESFCNAFPDMVSANKVTIHRLKPKQNPLNKLIRTISGKPDPQLVSALINNANINRNDDDAR